MKKLIAVAVLSATTASFAADRAIYDVQYLPNAGTTYGQTEWGYTNRTIEGKSGAGDIDAKGWGINQTVGHSLSDKLSLQLDINYLNATLDPDGGSKVDQKGLSDPTLTARYRLMDDAWRLDLIGGVLVSLGDSKVKSNGDTDNRQGGHAGFIGAQIGQKTEEMQWAVGARYTRNMKRTIDDKTVGSDVDIKSNNDLLLRADILKKVADKSLVLAHVSANYVAQLEDDDSNSSYQASSADYELGAQYQHVCSKDLLAYGGLDYQMYNSNTGYIDSDKAWVVTLGARYQF